MPNPNTLKANLLHPQVMLDVAGRRGTNSKPAPGRNSTAQTSAASSNLLANMVSGFKDKVTAPVQLTDRSSAAGSFSRQPSGVS